jgi:hypothetical protein
MHITSSAKLAAATVLTIFAITLLASGQSVEGTWDASVTVNNVSVPFRIEIDGTGADVHSYFFNGDDRVNPSNSGTFQNGLLVLNFDSYATKLEATLNDGILTGTYGGGSGNAYAFQAKRHDPSLVANSDHHTPDISGLWEIQVKSPKGESAWHFVVNQIGAKPLASPRVHQALWHRVHLPDRWGTKPAEREDATGRKPECLAHHILRWPKWPGALDPHWFHQSCERRARFTFER